MKISLLNHHSVKITGSKVTVLLDPSVAELAITTSDLVISSALVPIEPLAFNREKSGYQIKGPGEYEVKGIPVEGIQVDDTETIYLFEIEKVRLCHLGALSVKLPAKVLEEFGDVDVLFLPLNGESGLSGKLAGEVINQIEPLMVLPLFENEKSLLDFAKELGESDLRKETSLTITKSTLPPETEVVVLSN